MTEWLKEEAVLQQCYCYFKCRVGQNQETPSPTLCLLPTVAYENSNVSGHSLQDCFPGNILMPTVFPRPMSTNANEAFRQGLKKEKIKREIMANEITLAREQEIEKEVRMKKISTASFDRGLSSETYSSSTPAATFSALSLTRRRISSR
ncbi:hypothetical protein HKD37_19G052486 [Glycine soja]